MTTQQVAHRLVELCRAGEHDRAYRELFAQDASSHETPAVGMPPAQGLDALLAKSEAYAKDVEKVLKFEATEPVVYGDQFALGMGIQVQKDGQAGDFEREMCVYLVRDGKIVSEHFLYHVA